LVASRGQTQQRLGRRATGPGLITDLEQASYFKSEKVDVTEARHVTNK
jgi:hypothetical protein